MQHIPALDGLRTVAVLLVLLFHCKAPVGGLGGYIGVDIFFVLSGFLITSLLIKEADDAGRIDIARFYIRRAIRLWPALVLMLTVYALVAPWVFPDDNTLRDVALAGLYLSDYSTAFWGVPDKLSHTWSLAVEQHYYLIWPLVIIFAQKMPRSVLPVLFAALFVLATAWRVWQVDDWQSWSEVYYRFDTRLSGLILGSLLAVVEWRPGRLSAYAIATVAVIALAMSWLTMPWRDLDALKLQGAIVDLASVALVMALITPHKTHYHAALSARPMVYLGSISYGIYLWHYPIVRALEGKVGKIELVVLVSVLSIGAAALSHRFVEKPLLRWRDKGGGKTDRILAVKPG